MYAEICAPCTWIKMAWTYRSRRYSSRTVRRSFRRRRMARLAIALGIAVVAALARLPPRRQADVGGHWTNFAQSSGQARRYSPFYFAPTQLPGFPDYQLTYSQFRVLKCRLQLSLASEGGEVDNYLLAPVAPSPVTWALVV